MESPLTGDAVCSHLSLPAITPHPCFYFSPAAAEMLLCLFVSIPAAAHLASAQTRGSSQLMHFLSDPSQCQIPARAPLPLGTPHPVQLRGHTLPMPTLLSPRGGAMASAAHGLCPLSLPLGTCFPVVYPHLPCALVLGMLVIFLHLVSVKPPQIFPPHLRLQTLLTTMC